MSNQSLLYSFDNHSWFDLALQTNHRYDVAVKLRRVKQTRSRAKRLLLLFFLLSHSYLRYVRTSSSCPNLHSFVFNLFFFFLQLILKTIVAVNHTLIARPYFINQGLGPVSLVIKDTEVRAYRTDPVQVRSFVCFQPLFSISL